MEPINIEALIALNIDDSRARAAIARLQAMAKEAIATGGAGESVEDISREFAVLQQRIIEMRKAGRAAAGGDEQLVAANRLLSSRRSEAVSKSVKEVAAALPAAQGEQLLRNVGGAGDRERFYKDMQRAESDRRRAEFEQTYNPRQIAAIQANQDRASGARDEAERLRMGRGDTNLTDSLLALDIEIKRFHGVMEEARAGSEDYATAVGQAATAHQRSAKAVAEGMAADEKYLVATNEATEARKLLKDTLTLQAAGESTAGMTGTQIGDRAAALRRMERAETQARQLDAATQEEIDVAGQAVAAQATYRNDVLAAADAEGRLTAETIRAAERQAGISQERSISRAGLSSQEVQERGGREAAAAYANQAGAIRRQTTVIENLTEGDIAEGARLRALRAERSAAEGAGAASQMRQDPDALNIFTELAAEAKFLSAALKETQAGTAQYREAVVADATAHEASAARIASQKANDDRYRQATVEATQAREQLRDRLTLEAEGESGAGLTAQALGDRAAALRNIRRDEDASRRAGAASPEEVQARAERVVAEKRLANDVREAADAGGGLSQETLRSQAFMKAVGDRAAIMAAGMSEAEVARYGGTEDAAVHARRILAQEQEIRALETETEAEITRTARLKVLQGEREASVRAQVQEVNRSKAATGESGGSWFARFQALLKGNRPDQNPGGLAYVLTRGLSSLTHMGTAMVSGALLFGLVEAVREASKLQEALAGLQGQMRALGQQSQFSAVRDDIKLIADETGIAGTEVTKFAQRLLGIFDDPGRAMTETAAAMRLAVVSGTDLNTMLEEMVPVMRAFNVSAEEMGDLAVYIHDKFGIAEEQTLHFFGETASTAEEAGLSLTELGIIGAAAANSIGKTMTVTGEQLTKIFGTMTERQDQLFAIMRRRPETADLAGPLIDAFASGQTGEAFKLLLRDFDRLDKVQQDALVRTLGTRREWGLLNGIFQHSSELISDLTQAEVAQTEAAGGLNRRFEDVSNTLQKSMDRVKELFKNLVEGLANTGMGAGLAVVLKGLEAILQVGNEVVRIFNVLNNATKGLGFDTGILGGLVALGSILLTIQLGMAAYTKVKDLATRSTTFLTLAEERLKTASLESAGAQGVEGEAVAATAAEKEAAALIGPGGPGVGAGVRKAESTAASEGEKALISGGEGAGGAGAFAWFRSKFGGKAAAAAAESELPAGSVITQNMMGDMVVEAPAAAAPIVPEAAGGLGIGSLLSGLFPQAAAMLGPIVAGVVSGYTAASWARDTALPIVGVSQSQLADQSGAAAENVKKLSDDALKKKAAEGASLLDKFEEAYYDVDMPDTIYKKELARREGAGGRAITQKLLTTGKLGEFTKGISDANAANLEDFLKQADAQGFAEQYELLDHGKLNREKLQAKLPEIAKAAETGDVAANKFLAGIKNIADKQGTFADLRKILADADKKDDTDKLVTEAGGLEAFLQAQYDPKGALAIGAITPVQYQQNLERIIADKRKTLVGKGGEEAAKAYQELNAAIKELEDFRFNQAKERVDRIARVATETGDPAPAAARLKAILDAMPHLDLAHQFQMLGDLHKATQDRFAEELKHIQDPMELYRRQIEGIATTAQEQSLDIQNQVRQSITGQGVINQIAAHSDPLPGGAERITKEIADAATEQGITFAQALRQKYVKLVEMYEKMGLDPVFEKGIIAAIDAGAFDGIDAQKIIRTQHDEAEQSRIENTLRATEGRITLAKSAFGAQGRGAQAQFALQSATARLNAALDKQRNNIDSPNIQAEIDEAQAAVNDAQRGIADVVHDTEVALLNWAVIEAHGDPVAENTARLNIARNEAAYALKKAGGDLNDPDVIRAQQNVRELELQAQDNETNILRSRFSVSAALASRDPLESARIAMEQARFETEKARGTADYNEKLAAQIRAEHSYADALSAVFESRANLAAAIATANGDTIAALRIARDESQRKLDEARAQGVTGDALNPFLQQVVETNEALRKGTLQRQQQIIDFQLAMGQITTTTAIESLKLLLQQTKEGTDEYMQLAQKIHSLEQSASDLQFNLPTQLGLPTLYEARRVAQGTAMGIGYQDNRQIAVAINVNGAQDPAATAAQVMAAFQSATGAPSVYTGGVIGAGI